MGPKLTALLAKSLLRLEGLLPGIPSCPSVFQSLLFLEYVLPLGCCVHLSPVFAALRLHFPGVKISVATRGLGAELLRHNPLVDHLVITPDPTDAIWATANVLRRELSVRGVQPDLVLTGASDRRSRIAMLAVLARSGACRGGFSVADSLYQRPLAYDHELSLIDNNLRIVSLLGTTPEHMEPRVFFSKEDVDRMRSRLASAADPRPVVILVTQNSGGQPTGWHSDRFAAVIRFVEGELGFRSVYVGTTKEADSIVQIRRAAGGQGLSLAGETSVTELAALLAMSDFVVALDTGTMHIGRAVETPMVVLGPSWQRPVEWLPLGLPQVRILRGPDVERVPTGYRLDEIEVDQVTQALTDLVQRYPADEAARRRRLERSLSTTDHAAVQAPDASALG